MGMGFGGFGADLRAFGAGFLAIRARKSGVERLRHGAVFRGARPGPLFEERRQLRQNLVHDGGGRAFQPAPVAGAKIEGAGLVAADHARGFRPRPASGTAKPAVRAKLPPVVIGSTTGVFVSRLNAAGETTKTGRVPCCSCPAVGSSETR